MRRTPALTRQARELFEESFVNEGFTPGYTVPAIARATGLSDEQVRDSVFGPSADEWRRRFASSLKPVTMDFTVLDAGEAQ